MGLEGESTNVFGTEALDNVFQIIEFTPFCVVSKETGPEK